MHFVRTIAPERARRTHCGMMKPFASPIQRERLRMKAPHNPNQAILLTEKGGFFQGVVSTMRRSAPGTCGGALPIQPKELGFISAKSLSPIWSSSIRFPGNSPPADQHAWPGSHTRALCAFQWFENARFRAAPSGKRIPPAQLSHPCPSHERPHSTGPKGAFRTLRHSNQKASP